MSVSAADSGIDAVIFDWGGVITVDPDPIARRALEAAGVRAEDLRRKRDELPEDEEDLPFARLERGEITLSAYLEIVAVVLPGSEVLWDPESSHFLFPKLTVRPEVLDVIADLQSRGFKTGLLTNNVAETWPLLLETTPVEELFDVSVNSAFVGMRKPEHRIFHHTLELLGVTAGRAVLLDDVDVNITAARAVGMHTVRVRRPGSAIDALEGILAR